MQHSLVVAPKSYPKSRILQVPSDPLPQNVTRTIEQSLTQDIFQGQSTFTYLPRDPASTAREVLGLPHVSTRDTLHQMYPPDIQHTSKKTSEHKGAFF